MGRPNLLCEEDIQATMIRFSLWSREGDKIIREIVAANFVSIIGLVNSIAIIAETLDHHPDLLIYGWNKLRITLSTHDRGGLTELDFLFAKKIDEIGFNI